METTLAPSLSGLGITQCQTFQPRHEHQNLFIPSAATLEFPASTRQEEAAAHRIFSRSQCTSPQMYITSHESLTFNTVPDDRHEQVYPATPAAMVPLAHEGYFHQSNYNEQIVAPALDSCSQSSSFGYAPGPMQEGKWIATSHKGYAVSSEPAQCAPWQPECSPEYPRHVQFPVRDGSLGENVRRY